MDSLVRAALLVFIGTALTTTVAEARSLQLASAPGLEDHDVESVLRLEDRWVAGTARGVFSYDGVEWTSHAFEDTVRWLARRDGQILAGGSRGVWTAEPTRLEFRLLPGSPPKNRCALQTGSTELLVGTDDGLFAEVDGEWQVRLPDHRVQCLAEHPERGLLIGTWGDGLLARDPDGHDTWMRCPAAGVTDTLSGDYIHDIEVDGDGTTRLACSYGQLAPRYFSHRFVRQRGLTSERDPHTYLRASLATFGRSGWKVKYLCQDYSEHGIIEPRSHTLYWGRLLGSERTQWVVSLDSGRGFFPSGIASFDLQTHELLWFREFAGRIGPAIPLSEAGGIVLAFAVAGSDMGAVWGGLTDDVSRLVCVDGRGNWNVLFETPRVIRILPAPSENRIFPPCESFEFLEQPHTVGDRASSKLWKLRTALASDSFAEVAFEDELCFPGKPWARRDADHSLVGGWAVDEADSARLTVRSMEDCTVRRKLSDSSRQLLTTDPLARTLSVDLQSGDPAWAMLSQRELVLDDESGPRRWPNPIPIEGLNHWTWSNLLSLDSPQVLVDRGSAGPMEIWAFDGARYLAHSRAQVPTPLHRSGLDGLSRICTFDPRPRSSEDAWGSLRALRDARHALVGWACVEDHLAVVQLFSPEGTRTGSITLPPALRGQAPLRWTTGPTPPDAIGASAPVLYSPHAHPMRLFRLVDEGRRWEGPYSFPPSFVDLHCNGITALCSNPQVVGSESGIRGRPVDDAAGSRVRGFLGERVAYGAFGVVDLDPSPRAWKGDAITDVVLADGRLHAATAAGFFVWDGTWRLELPLPLRAARGVHLISSTHGRLYGQGINADLAAGGLHALDPNDPLLRRYDNPTFFDLGVRALHAIVEFDTGDALIASDHGLHLLPAEPSKTNAEDPRIPLLDAPTPVLDAVLLGDSLGIASVSDGRVLLVHPQEPTRTVLSPLSRTRKDAVEEFVVQGSDLWVRTSRGVERWDIGQQEVIDRWPLPDSIRTRSMCSATGGGVWLGCDRGLWRARGDDSLLLPAVIDDLPTEDVRRVLEFDGYLVVLENQELHRIPIPREVAVPRMQPLAGQSILAAWKDGPLDGNGWAVTQAADGSDQLVRAVARADGATVLATPDLGRGRHRFRAWRVGPSGTRLEPALEIWQTSFDRSGWIHALVLLLSAALLGTWAFNPHRHHRFGLLVLTATIVVCLIVYRGFYFELPWGSLTGVSAAVIATGIALRERERSRHIPRGQAIARLDDLLRGFRHRGGGLNPIDELRIQVIHLGLLRETEADFDESLREVLRRVLDATADLSAGGPHLVAFTQLEATLLTRFFHRLEELRVLCVELLEDPKRYAHWLVRPDEHLACAELCASFTQAAESMTELLARHRDVIVERFLPAYCRTLDRRGSAHVEFVNDDRVETLPIEQGQLAEVLDNLVGNAVRAAQGRGRVHLRISLRRFDATSLLRFEDNGPGIPAELRGRIFDKGYSQSSSGGFGLARCRELVEGWGGAIECSTSEDLGGACFEIWAPH